MAEIPTVEIKTELKNFKHDSWGFQTQVRNTKPFEGSIQTVSVPSKETAKEVFKGHAANICCWGKEPATDFEVVSIEEQNDFTATLWSFVETRGYVKLEKIPCDEIQGNLIFN